MEENIIVLYTSHTNSRRKGNLNRISTSLYGIIEGSLSAKFSRARYSITNIMGSWGYDFYTLHNFIRCRQAAGNQPTGLVPQIQDWSELGLYKNDKSVKILPTVLNFQPFVVAYILFYEHTLCCKFDIEQNSWWKRQIKAKNIQ